MDLVHEDSRRYLIDLELPADPNFRLKIVVAKSKKTLLGDHYHKQKTEIFKLLHGRATAYTRNVDDITHSVKYMKEGDILAIYPNTIHKFVLPKGAILMCHADKSFDPSDDYRETVVL